MPGRLWLNELENVHAHYKNGGKANMKKHFSLQIFDDGSQSGAGAQGAQGGAAGTGNSGQASTGNNGGGYSFQQAEEIANARAERAEKAALSSYFKQQGMSEEEVNQALKDYKANKEKQKPNVDAITQERDKAVAELAAMKQTQTLQARGVKAEDMDYVQFKIGKLMEADDKLDFEKAMAKFLKESPRYAQSGSGYRVKTGTDASQGSGSQQGDNASINDAIRRAARR